MWRRIIRLVEKIRNSDEAVKRRWVLGASALSMALVILLWLSYGNIFTAPTGESLPQPSYNQPEFLAVMKNGLIILADSFENKFKDLLSGLKWEHSITINNNQ